jgi:hypothetical protein
MQKRKDKVINTKESGSEHDPAALISRCARLNSEKHQESRARARAFLRRFNLKLNSVLWPAGSDFRRFPDEMSIDCF